MQSRSEQPDPDDPPKFNSYLDAARTRRGEPDIEPDYGPPVLPAGQSPSQPQPPARSAPARTYSREEKEAALQAAIERQMKYMSHSPAAQEIASKMGGQSASPIDILLSKENKEFADLVPDSDANRLYMTEEEKEARDIQIARQRMLLRIESERRAGGFIPSSRASDDYLTALKQDALQKLEVYEAKLNSGEPYIIEGIENYVPIRERGGIPEIKPPVPKQEDKPISAAPKGKYQELLMKKKGQSVPQSSSSASPQPAPVAQVRPVPPPAPVAQVRPAPPPAPVAQVRPVPPPAPVAQVRPVPPPAPAAQARPVSPDRMVETVQQLRSAVAGDLDVDGISLLKNNLQLIKQQLKTESEQSVAPLQALEISAPTPTRLKEEATLKQNVEDEVPEIYMPKIDRSENAVALRKLNSLLMVHLNTAMEGDDLQVLRQALVTGLRIIDSQIEASSSPAAISSSPVAQIEESSTVLETLAARTKPQVQSSSSPAVSTDAASSMQEKQQQEQVFKGSNQGLEYDQLAQAFGLLVKHRGGGPFGLGRLVEPEASTLAERLQETCAILRDETNQAYGFPPQVAETNAGKLDKQSTISKAEIQNKGSPFKGSPGGYAERLKQAQEEKKLRKSNLE